MIFLIFAVLHFGAHGASPAPESCKDTFNLPEFLKEPRDQADIGWCYAYAGADLASAYAGQEISAADIAIHHNYGKIKKSIIPVDRSSSRSALLPLDDGGDMTKALQERAVNDGFCLEKDFPSSVIQKVVDNPQKKMSEVLKIPLSDRLYQVLKLGQLNYTPVDCNKNGISQAFPNLPIQEISEALYSFDVMDGDTNRSLRLAYLAQQNCDSRRIPGGFAAKDVGVAKLTIASMNQALDEGKVATVGLPMLPYVKIPTPEQLEKFKGDRLGLEKSQGDHAMLLVGRKWDRKTGSCQFIFKNSWGKAGDGKTVNGYTVLPESELAQVPSGEIATIHKAPTWKPGSMPDFLQ